MKKKANRPASGKKRRAQSGGWWLAAAVITGALVVGLATVRRSGPGTTGAPSEARNVAPADPAEQERALREEQVQAAQKLTSKFPESDDAVYLLGLVHNEQGDSVTACSQWERSLQLDPSRADANESLGYALLLKDDYEGAEKYLRRALELDYKLVTARFRLATTFVHEGRFREAVDLFEIVPSDSFTPEIHRLLGEAYQQLKEYDKAKSSYAAALRLNPEMAEAHYALSRISSQLGESENATNHFEQFTALKHKSETQARDVRSNYNTLVLTRQSVARTHTDVGRVYMMQGMPREAEAFWLRAAALDSTNILCRLQLAVHCQRSNQNAEALRYYEEVMHLDPSDALVHMNIGRVSLKLNQLGRAEQAFKEVVRLAPDRPEGQDALVEVRAMINAKGKP